MTHTVEIMRDRWEANLLNRGRQEGWREGKQEGKTDTINLLKRLIKEGLTPEEAVNSLINN